MGPHFDPFFRALGGFPVSTQAVFARHSMHLIDPDCITSPDDGGKIAGFVQTFSQDSQVRLPAFQHPVESVAAIRSSQSVLR
jgi:hypothetical protein